MWGILHDDLSSRTYGNHLGFKKKTVQEKHFLINSFPDLNVFFGIVAAFVINTVF